MRLALASSGCPPALALSNIVARVAGIELDGFLAWASQVFVEAALLPLTAAYGSTVPLIVTNSDALTAPATWLAGSFDLVIGNPPYGRTSLAPDLRQTYQKSLYGHANLYGVFTHLATMLVRPGGLVGYVTPTSFLGGQYFKELRRLLLDTAPPLAVDFITDRSGVFEDVLQETLLVVLKAQRPGQSVRVQSVKPTGLAQPSQVGHIGTIPLMASGDEPWLLPRTVEHQGLLAKTHSLRCRLSDYGYQVSTGPLVWNRHKDQLSGNPDSSTYPLIWAESIRPDGTFRFAAERRNHLPYFHPRPRQGHLVTSGPCVLVQRTTAKEQERRIVAACLPGSFVSQHGGVVVENHLNVIRPMNGKPRVGLEALTALLNSSTVDAVFRCISGSVAVSAYELESLPLPEVELARQLETMLQENCPREVIEARIAEMYEVRT